MMCKRDQDHCWCLMCLSKNPLETNRVSSFDFEFPSDKKWYYLKNEMA